MNGNKLLPELIVPDWPAPQSVKSLSTTRVGGYSSAPFDSFNLGIRAGDDPDTARRNRALLCEHARLPAEPCWLWQVHSTQVVDATVTPVETRADASWTINPGVVCVAMAADCLPVLFADRRGTCVAAAHAGWRGLLNGVLEAVVNTLPSPPDELLAWLGPAIGPSAFEVGDDVRDAYLANDDDSAACFQPGCEKGKWMADLPGLARARLQKAGVYAVHGANRCTYTESQVFYSYRRDGKLSGRMASLIWLE